MSKKNYTSTWTPELPPVEISETRAAAAAWIYALKYEPKQELSLLRPLLSECFPNADLETVAAMVKHQSPYEDITDELIDEVLENTHAEGYEILPWREAVLRVLIIDFLANLKSSSAQLIEDSLNSITSTLDPKLRGTSKNASQTISGQRTHIRKAVRTLVLAELYQLHYRPDLSDEDLQNNLMGLVQSCPDTEFITDEFPFEDYVETDGSICARGRYAFCEALKIVRNIKMHQDKIDEIIQNSSKRWRVTRMSVIDLNILRLATFELCFEQTLSPKILINEAVELAKIFGADQSKNFVNGILQQLCNDNQISVNG